MADSTQAEIDRINTRYVEVARKNALNPVWLREIVGLHNQGFTYSEIARRMGVSRETVSTYLQRLGSANRNDYWLLLLGAVLIGGGMYALYKYFGDSTPETQQEGP